MAPENALFWGEKKNLDSAVIAIQQKALPWLAQELSKKKFGGTLILGGVPCRGKGSKYFNRWLVFSGGKWSEGYAKRNLFRSEVPGQRAYSEDESFEGSAASLEILKTRAGAEFSLGPSVCFDLRFPDLYSDYRRLGADVLAVPSCFTQKTGEAHWHVLLRARAIETQCFVIAPAQTGKAAGNREAYGHTLAVDPWGKVIFDAEDKVGLFEVKLDLSQLATVRSQIKMSTFSR